MGLLENGSWGAPSTGSAVWPPASGSATPEWSARLGISWRRGLVPPFRAAARDRGAIEVALGWSPHPRVGLDLRFDALRDQLPTGEVRVGPGDLRLGVEAGLWQGAVDLDLGWQVKLPDARDEGELGTDETDVLLFARISRALGPARLALQGGLGILGDPLRFANQDDVPLLWLAGSLPAGPLDISARVGGGLPGARNPARLDAAVGLERGCPRRGRWLVGGEVLGGLTPAAEDWGIRAWAGVTAACPEPARD